MVAVKKETWIQVWPPRAEVTDPALMLIEPQEKACDQCRQFFGWVFHRHYSKGVGLIHVALSNEPWYAVGYWNEDRSMFTTLGWFQSWTQALLAHDHLAQVVSPGLAKESA